MALREHSFVILFCPFFLLIGWHEFADTTPIIDDGHLIMAQALCRHGDRNIGYKERFRDSNDPWRFEKYWPGGFGALTDVGKRQEYALGQYLGMRYASLIGNDDSSLTNINVQSTDTERVVESARAAMCGLLSLLNVTNRDDDLLERIPMKIIPEDVDTVLAPSKHCDRYNHELIKYLETPEYQQLLEGIEPFLKYIENETGLELSGGLAIDELYDRLFVENLKGFRLPLWAKQVIKPGGYIEYLDGLLYSVATQSTEMKKIMSGFLLKEILDRFVNKTHSQLIPDCNLFIYFAHDNQIANMRNSLGIFNFQRPPYASCILFELYETITRNYIQVFYRNSTDDVRAEYIPKCGTECPLDEWFELYRNILPNQSFEMECALQENEISPSE